MRLFASKFFLTKSISLLLAGLLLTNPLGAWNKPGHMVTGVMTYQFLKDNDSKALARVVAILKGHPQYQSLWLPQIKQFTITPEQADQYLLMLAARWPDDARDSEYDHADWHYVNFPYKPGKQAATPASVGGKLLDAYIQNVEILKGDAPEREKAVALCWVLHLIGDVHQPLHSVTLMSKEFPEGDRGGSRFYIKAGADAKTIPLHKFWDDLITGTPRFRETLNVATELRNRPAFKRSAYPQLAATDFKAWALESYGLAAQKAYLNGELPSGQSKEAGVVLPATYAKEAKAVAERQVVLAGYRMSDLLASLF